MEAVAHYLRNPMEVGVLNCRLVLDLSSIREYLEEMIKQLEKSKNDSQRKMPTSFIERRIGTLKEELEQLNEQSPTREEYFGPLLRTISHFARACDCPGDMKRLFLIERMVRVDGKERLWPRPRDVPIFGSRIVQEANDVIAIDRKYLGQNKWFFDATTMKDAGISTFKKDLSCIPPIKDRMRIIRQGKQFSSRYVYRPYPLAVRLWLGDEAAVSIPSDIKGFLEGAVNYMSSQEWRTSIVLSAIAVESILADLYEEEFKTSAPDTPLGDLFEKVKKKIVFPANISSAIDGTNRARIAAVHRSRLSVSEKEAINALYGAVIFAEWIDSVATEDLQRQKPTA